MDDLLLRNKVNYEHTFFRTNLARTDIKIELPSTNIFYLV